MNGRLASALHRAGALDAVLRARATVRAPLLTVLPYHHIADPQEGYRFDPNVAYATPDQFRRHLEVVAKHFTVIGIDELCASLDGEPLPPSGNDKAHEGPSGAGDGNYCMRHLPGPHEKVG